MEGWLTSAALGQCDRSWIGRGYLRICAGRVRSRCRPAAYLGWPPHIPDKTAHTYNLPDAEFIKELRSLNGTPKEVLGIRR